MSSDKNIEEEVKGGSDKDYDEEDDDIVDSDINLNCRFYKKKFPDPDEIKVKRVEDNGAYVELLEYNEIEGMIMVSEYSKKRTKTVNRFIKVGKEEPAIVLRVDEKKGYIDLSKKKVKPNEAAECEVKYKRNKTVHSILKQTAQRLKVDLEVIYETVCWPLYDKETDPYDAFKMAVNDNETVFQGIEIDEKTKEELLANIKKRMAQHPLKIRADFEITCFTYEGIDAIKEVLHAAEAIKDEELIVRLIAPPIYEISTSTLEKSRGISLIEKALKEVEARIKEKKGNYLLKNPPQAIGGKDEKDIEEMLEKFNEQQNELGGDADEDNEEGIDIDIGVEEHTKEKKMESSKNKKGEEDDDDDDDDE